MNPESFRQLVQDYHDICEEFDERLCPNTRGWPASTPEYLRILEHERRVFAAILPRVLRAGYTDEQFQTAILSKIKRYDEE